VSPAVFAIAQAKLGSKRLPRKVVLPLGARPVVEWVLRRAAKARVDGVALAIPDGFEDDSLKDLAVKKRFTVYRGEADDVQARYIGAANALKAKVCVRLTCDNPFVDAPLIDAAVAAHRAEKADYTAFAPPFPLGLSVEVFTLDALRRARALSTQPYHREHVTPALYEHPETFRIHRLPPPPSLQRDDVRLTLDTPDDYAAIQALVALVPDEDPLAVGAERYVELMAAHPEICALNAHVRQKRLGE